MSNDGKGAGVAFLAFHKGSNWNNPPGVTATPIIYAAINTQAVERRL